MNFSGEPSDNLSRLLVKKEGMRVEKYAEGKSAVANLIIRIHVARLSPQPAHCWDYSLPQGFTH